MRRRPPSEVRHLSTDEKSEEKTICYISSMIRGKPLSLAERPARAAFGSSAPISNIPCFCCGMHPPVRGANIPKMRGTSTEVLVDGAVVGASISEPVEPRMGEKPDTSAVPTRVQVGRHAR
jgi:hypothetical protein